MLRTAFRRIVARDGSRLTSFRGASSSNKTTSLFSLLTPEESTMLKEQQEIVQETVLVVKQVGGKVKIRKSRFLIDDSAFSIVLAGEFNAGKSTVINALLGKKLLETGALPTTDCITVLTHSRDTVEEQVDGAIFYKLPEVPQDLSLVDTPGTNAVLLDHTSRTLELLPNADWILFCTSADRPFPESERSLLKQIQKYRKNIVLVINKMDILDSSGGSHGQDEKTRVINYVADHASELLGARPHVIPISARDALVCKTTTFTQSLWERSNFESLESFLSDSLTTEAKVKAKLSNPLGVSEGMLAESVQVLEEESKELEVDTATMKLLNSQFMSWEREMNAEMELFRKGVADVLLGEKDRVKMMVARIGYLSLLQWSLFSPERIRSEWARSIVEGEPRQEILERIDEFSDLIVRKAKNQGQGVVEYLGKRPARMDLVGKVQSVSNFEDVRTSLVDKLSTATDRSLLSRDSDTDRLIFTASVTLSARAACALQLASIGTASATALEMVDSTMGGGTAFGALAISALVAIRGVAGASSAFEREWRRKHNEILEAFDSVCPRELDRIQRQINDGISPYSRFVESEDERLQTLLLEANDLLSRARRLRNRITKLRHYD